MGTIKLNRDELCRNINALDSLKEEINRVLRECSNIGSALNSVNVVSTSRQRRVLQDMQSCLCNFRNGISDLGGDLHDAVRTYDVKNEQINGIINNHKNYNFNYKLGNVCANNGGISSSVNDIANRNLKNEGFTESKVTSLFQMSDAQVNNTIAMVGQATGSNLKNLDNLACRDIQNGINTIANDIKVFTYNEPVHIKGAVVAPRSAISSLYNTNVEANVGNCSVTSSSNIGSLCTRAKIWIKDVFDKVKAKIASLFQAFKEKFSALGNKLLDLCKNLGSKVVNAVKSVIKGVKDFVLGVLKTVASAVLSVADLLVTVILSAVKSIGKLFGCNCKGLDNAIASVNNFFYDLAPDKKTFEVCRKIVDFASYLIPYFGVIRTALELISGVDIGSGRDLTVFERLLSIASLFGGKLIAKAGGKIFSKLGKYASRALDAVDNIGTKVLSKFRTLMPKIASYGDEFAKFISANYNKISEKLSGLLGGFKSDVKNVFSKAGNLLKRMSESEARFLSKIENAFKNLGQKFTSSLKNVFRNAAGVLDDISSKLSPEFATAGGPSIKGESTFFRDTVDDFISRIEGKVGGSGVGTKGMSNPKLKFNNAGEYYSYITDIGKRVDINNEQKLKLIQEAYEALGNAKGDITCISDIKYLKSEGFGANGRPMVDWPKFMGFDVDSIKGITRENPLPNKWDRIGAIGGENFTTLPSDGKIFSFDERAIPYLENLQARHIGDFNNDIYFDVIDAIKGNDINKLNSIMNKNGIDCVSQLEFKRINSTYNNFIDRVKVEIGDMDATYGLKGSAAPWKINGEIHMNGGAEQIVTPLTGNFLERLGVLNIEF